MNTKIGIISDIHSNYESLLCVLNYFEQEKVDRIIFLGDAVGIGYNPDEVVKYLKNYNTKIDYIIGNHENYIIDSLPTFVHGTRTLGQEEIENHLWNQNKLSKDSKKFIHTFEKETYINVNGITVYACHFPMDENAKYITYEHFEDVLDYFDNIEADICLFGHTHKAYYKENNKYIINPGAVGCPKNINCAQAGILTIADNIKYEQLNIPYDIDKEINKILDSNMPMKESIIKIFYNQK